MEMIKTEKSKLIELENAADYQQCVRCVMDTTDVTITFDEKGVCSHCYSFDNVLSKKWLPNVEGKRKLNAIIEKIKADGKGKDYDCIMGLSGGVDSSYIAHLTKQYGLRVLAIHVDAGWNSELAVNNIEMIVKKCDNIELHTDVIDWEVMQDLHRAFFRAGLANQDIPQDHAFLASVYNFAVKHNFKYVINGSNIATESILPRSWGYYASDDKHIKAVHKIFGEKSLKGYPFRNFFDQHFYHPIIRGMKVVNVLNYLPYKKKEAIQSLEKEFGWIYYGGKHYESRFTKFFQAHYLPTKFGFDKRKAHLSSLILSKEITREEALIELQKPLYDAKELDEDRDFFIKKLGITEEEYYKVMNEAPKTYKDYPNNENLFTFYYNISQKYKKFVPKGLRAKA